MAVVLTSHVAEPVAAVEGLKFLLTHATLILYHLLYLLQAVQEEMATALLITVIMVVVDLMPEI
jgi:hypothetical protein